MEFNVFIILDLDHSQTEEAMKIHRDGFICQTAFLFAPDNKIPASIGICQLFWRFIGGMIGIVFFYVFGAIVDLLVTIIAGVFAGKYGNIVLSTRKDPPPGTMLGTKDAYPLVRDIPHWPVVLGTRSWLAILLGMIGLVWILFNANFLGATISRMMPLIKIGIVLTGIVLILLLLWSGIRWYKHSETRWLVGEFLRAKGRKVCLLVEIESSPEL